MGAAAAAPAAAAAAAVPLQQLLQQPAQAASQRQRPPQQPAQAAPQAASGRQQSSNGKQGKRGQQCATRARVLGGGISTARAALAFVSLACLRARRPAGMTQLRGRGPGDVHGHDHGDGHRHGLEPARAQTKFSTTAVLYLRFCPCHSCKSRTLPGHSLAQSPNCTARITCWRR